MTYRIPSAVLLIILTFPGAASGQDGWAEEPLVTDRPDFTESALTVGRGRLQVEGGYTFTKKGDDNNHSLGELLLRLGLLERLEARLGINPLSVVDRPGRDESSGPDDINVGAKYNFIDASRGLVPELGLLGSAVIPLKNDDRPAAIPALTLAAAWILSDDLSLASNLGWVYGGVTDNRFSSFSGSVALGVSLGKRWGAYAEYFGFVRTGGNPNENFVNTGLTFLVSPNFQLDGRIGTGFEDPQPNYFAGVGASFRF